MPGGCEFTVVEREGWRPCALFFGLMITHFPCRRRQRQAFLKGAVPSVDDSQAGDVDRPVRDVGLYGLRAKHHVVPTDFDMTDGVRAIRGTENSNATQRKETHARS
jgi:hypothetical protein